MKLLSNQDSCNVITHHYVQENGDSVGWVKFHFHHLSFDAVKNNSQLKIKSLTLTFLHIYFITTHYMQLYGTPSTVYELRPR